MGCGEEYAVQSFFRVEGRYAGLYRHVPLAHVWEILEGLAERHGRRLRLCVFRETGPLGMRFGAALIDDRVQEGGR